MVGPTTNQRLERQRLAAEHQIRQLRRLRELDPAALGWCMEVEVPYPVDEREITDHGMVRRGRNAGYRYAHDLPPR